MNKPNNIKLKKKKKRLPDFSAHRILCSGASGSEGCRGRGGVPLSTFLWRLQPFPQNTFHM